MKRKTLTLMLLLGMLVGSVNAVDFQGGNVQYFSVAGGGAILFDDNFTADGISWVGGYIQFSNFNDGEPFSTIGFKNVNAGTTMTFNSFNHTNILFTIVGGAGLTYNLYLPTVPNCQVVTAGVIWAYDQGTHVLTITQDAGASNIYLIWGGEAPGGGAGGGGDTEPPVEPPVEPPNTPGGSGTIDLPDWVPPPVEEVIVRIYPWWQRYGGGVLVVSLISVFALNSTGGKKRRSPLDVVLNPERKDKRRKRII